MKTIGAIQGFGRWMKVSMVESPSGVAGKGSVTTLAVPTSVSLISVVQLTKALKVSSSFVP